jgi:pyrroline-5-carboxylate reductase
MTNTNALIQQSCSVFSKGTNATDGKSSLSQIYLFIQEFYFKNYLDDAKCVKNLLEAIGTCENEVAEDSMDVISNLN